MNDESITIYIDKDLKTKFKIIAIQQGKSMKEILTEFIENYVDEHGWTTTINIFSYKKSNWVYCEIVICELEITIFAESSSILTF